MEREPPELEQYIYRKCIYKKEGDKIEFFDNAAKCLGIIFMKFPDEKQMFDMMNRMDELVYIDLLEKD